MATGRCTPLAHISPFRFAPHLLAVVLAAALGAQQADTRPRLRLLRITTSDVFAADDPRFLTRVVNALHWQTRQEVVAREVFVQPGDRIDEATAAEVERNLRALGLFADVTARLVPTAKPDEVDLEITTRDRLTLAFGAGGSYVGGVSGFRAAVGETNLLGLGDRLVGSFSHDSEGEYRGSLAYTDLHVLDSWHTATVRVSRTDEGDSAGFELRRPFKHLADPRSHAVAIAQDETATDYYRGGDSLAEVPYRRGSLRADLTWGEGSRDNRRYLGLTLQLQQLDYGTAQGPLAPEIRVPGDTTSVLAGPTATWRWVDGYRKVTGLDTLDFVQDLTLGPSFTTLLGARWRDEQGRDGALQPEASCDLTLAAEPLGSLYTNLGLHGGARWDDGDAAGWYAGGFARAFVLAAGGNTLAANLVFDATEETQDLPAELTLGEDNGLRGYRARLLSGTRRLRANLEHRFDTGIELATFRLGLVAFHDAGWMGRDGDLGGPLHSLGAGLRIGSKPLLGGGVLRIDVAKPLDDVIDQSDGWKVSVTVGQVFGFGGN